MMENLNLIRKIAWHFAKKTNLEYDELFSEASLAYCEAVERFDPNNGAKLITYAYRCMWNHLINFCRYETKLDSTTHWHAEFPEYLHPTTEEEPVNVYDIIEGWPEDCRVVAKAVLENPEQFLGQTPNLIRNHTTAKQRVKSHLKRRGWKTYRIQKVMRDMRNVLQGAA